jgi:hypothetical protein
MANTGWLSAGSARTFASGSSAWSSVGNITASDNSYATTNIPGSSYSNTLIAYNFGQSIPAGATIDGIEVSYEGKVSTGTVGAYTYLVTNAATNDGTTGTVTNVEWQTFSTTDATVTIGNQSGGITSTWSKYDSTGSGTGDRDIIASDIVGNSGFGVSLFCIAYGSTITLSLDQVQMRIWYTEAPTTVGPKDGALGLTSGGTVSWATPSNALTSDNAYTTHTTSTTAANMPYLTITGYDFSMVPSDSTITGITVSVERKYTGGTTGNVRDNTLQLMKAGTRVGTNKAATAANWGTTDTTISYGGPTDLWGTTWTPAEIKASNFGASFRAVGNGTSANRVANVDDISISVSYTGGTVVETDPYWANVVAALHFNGTNGSTTMLDQTGRPWSANNGAAITTTAPIVGTGSLALDGTDDYISSTSYLNDLKFGTGDFTLEIDFKTSATADYQVLFDYITSTSVPGFQLYLLPGGSGLGFYSGTTVGTECSTHSWNDGDWHQAVVTRSGTTERIFLDGILYSTATNTVNYNTAAPALVVGRQNYNGAYSFNGKLDEVRITNGIARYTAAFSTPLTEFPHGDPSYTAPAVELAYTQTVAFTQSAAATITKALAYNQSVSFSQTAALTTPKSLGYAQAVSFAQSAALTTPKSLAYTQAVSFSQTATVTTPKLVAYTQAVSFAQSAALTTPKSLAYTQSVSFSQTAALTVGSQPMAYNQVINFVQTAALTTPKFVGYTQAVAFTQTATLTTPKALSYAQSIAVTQTAALTTPRSLGYAQSISFTQSAELTVGHARPDFDSGGAYAPADPKEHRERSERRRRAVEDLIDPKPVAVEPEPELVVLEEAVELLPMSVEPFSFPIINISAEEVQMVADFLAQQRNLAMRQRIREAIKGVGNGLHGRMPGM